MIASMEMREFGYQQVAIALLYMAITQGGQAYSTVDLNVISEGTKLPATVDSQRPPWRTIQTFFLSLINP